MGVLRSFQGLDLAGFAAFLLHEDVSSHENDQCLTNGSAETP